jgi:lipoate-protein ligase B
MCSVSYLRAEAVDYGAAWHWQRETAAALRAGQGGEACALLEHTPVYTMGARGGRASLRAAVEALPAPLVDSDRGGDITWHGPGQLVAYPILHLRRRGLGAAAYVGRLEAMLLDTLAAFGVRGELIAARRGVWVGGDKIAAVGVRVQGGVGTHGVALNVAPDLDWFAPIVPCGLADAGVTSLARLLGVAPPVEAVAAALCAAFERRFDATLVAAPTDALRMAAPA